MRISKLYTGFLEIPNYILPGFIRSFADTERFTIDRFVRIVIVPRLKATDLLLDAGSGTQRYRDDLSAAQYVATDFEQIFDENSKARQDFICSLDAIPKPDNTYDVIVNTQVLEHIADPQKVIDELFRVLKPGGALYLTTNQMFHLHHAPHNYFFFTEYGLRLLFEKAGFEIESVKPRGGFFFVLAKMLYELPSYLFFQTAYSGHKSAAHHTMKPRSIVHILFLAPLYVVTDILVGRLLASLVACFDGIDRHKDFTLGHACICKKPKR